MKKTNKEIIALFTTLKALNGADRVVHAEGKDRVITEPYKFSDGASYQVAKNLNICRRHVKAFQKEQEEVTEEYKAGLETLKAGLKDADSPEGKKEIEKYNKEYDDKFEALLKKEVEVEGLLKMKLSALGVSRPGEGGVDRNPIQPGTIADLEDAGLIES